MNTQIVNVPARGTGHKAHAKQEHPGDGQTWPESSHVASPWWLRTPLFSAQGQPPFPRLPFALFSLHGSGSHSKGFGEEGQVAESPREAFCRDPGVTAPLTHDRGALLYLALTFDLSSVVPRKRTLELPWKLEVGGSQTRLVLISLQGEGNVLTPVVLLPCTGGNVQPSLLEHCPAGRMTSFPRPAMLVGVVALQPHSDPQLCYHVPGTQASSGGGMSIRFSTLPPKGLRLGPRTKETRLQSPAWVQGWSSQLGTISSIFSLAQSWNGERPWVRQSSWQSIQEGDVVWPAFFLSSLSRRFAQLPSHTRELFALVHLSRLGAHDSFPRLMELHRPPIYFVYIKS